MSNWPVHTLTSKEIVVAYEPFVVSKLFEILNKTQEISFTTHESSFLFSPRGVGYFGCQTIKGKGYLKECTPLLQEQEAPLMELTFVPVEPFK